MKELLSVVIMAYIAIATVTFMGFHVSGMRDCELSSVEECVWVVVPVSQSPQDQRTK